MRNFAHCFRVCCFVLIMSMLMLGCARSNVNVDSVSLSKHIIMNDIEHLTIGYVEGENSQQLFEFLDESLQSVRTFHYLTPEIFEYELIRKSIERKDLSDISSLLTIGQEFSKTAVILVKVTGSDFSISDSTPIKRRASAEISFEIVNPLSGDLLSTKNLSAVICENQLNLGDNVHKNELLNDVYQKIVHKFIKAIDPDVIIDDLDFIVSDDIPESNMGIQNIREGDYDRAVELYDNLTKQYPQSWELLYNYGLALMASERFAEAIEKFNEAYTLEPSELIRDRIEYCHSVLDDVEMKLIIN